MRWVWALFFPSILHATTLSLLVCATESSTRNTFEERLSEKCPKARFIPTVRSDARLSSGDFEEAGECGQSRTKLSTLLPLDVVGWHVVRPVSFEEYWGLYVVSPPARYTKTVNGELKGKISALNACNYSNIIDKRYNHVTFPSYKYRYSNKYCSPLFNFD